MENSVSRENYPSGSEKMNIVFILPGIGISGGVRVTVIQANYLIERGHSVRILYRQPSRNLRNIYRSAY